MIPTVSTIQWKPIGIAILLAGVFYAGWAANGWRLNLEHKAALSEKDVQISDMAAHIVTQNAAVDILKEKKESADARRKIAEQYNMQTVKRINSLESVIASLQGTSCESVIKEAWEKFK